MRERQEGFTLIEFSVCSLATMLMLAATFTLMNSLFTANSGMTDIMATQTNIRVAINTIARDITIAGTGLPTGSVELPNGTGAAAIIRPGMSSFSAPGRNINAPNDALPFLSPGDGAGPTVSNVTDALTIFTVDQQTPTWTVSAVALFSDRYEVTFTQSVNAGAMLLKPGDLLLFNNTNGSILACVSDISTVTTAKAFFRATDLMGINQPAVSGGNLGSLSSTVPPSSSYPPTTAIRINLINYFISTANASHPRLMRAVNAEAAQVMAADIENLQFSYDTFDYNSEVQTSDQANPAAPNQIRAALIAVTGRSPDRLKNTNNYYRFQLVSKINVRNSTFRNRYAGS